METRKMTLRLMEKKESTNLEYSDDVIYVHCQPLVEIVLSDALHHIHNLIMKKAEDKGVKRFELGLKIVVEEI